MRVGVSVSALLRSLGIGLLFLFALGCGSSETREVKLEPSLERLKVISRAYIEASRDLEHPPQNAGELMPYLKGGRIDPAEILRSPTDGQEYTIIWGVDMNNLPPVEGPPNNFIVLAYEKQGRDGKRWVAGFRRARQMTDEEFKDAPFPPGHKAPE